MFFDLEERDELARHHFPPRRSSSSSAP
jgi:hypothetical protein